MSKANSGQGLVEVMVAVTIGAVVSLGALIIFGTCQGLDVRIAQKVELTGVAQRRIDDMFADLSHGSTSLLAAALPKDFSNHYVTASGNSAAPWTISGASTSEPITSGDLNGVGYSLLTKVQYYDDPADGLAPTDTNPYDALMITVSVVPTAQGASNVQQALQLSTYWYF